MSSRPFQVLIAAGGTGGHIYPALAMADAFQRLRPGIQIQFVGTPHGLENKLIPAKGYSLHHLSIGRLHSSVGLKERLKTLFALPWSMVQAFFILRKTKPDIVLGVGGHASGPLLLVASILRYRTAIWEPNAFPGLANRILSRFVDECWVVFDEAKSFLKSKTILQAGMPVRLEIEKVVDQSDSNVKFRLLIFGGSQGAKGINNAVVEMIKKNPALLENMHIVHQTGAADYNRIVQDYGSLVENSSLEVREYLHDMDQQYAKANLVICRSGTGTLSELAACGKAAILIPFPFASDDHQRKNAESLASKGAAVLLLQKDLTAAKLHEMLLSLQGSPERRSFMSTKIRDFHQPQAADQLVQKFIARMEEHASR